MDRISGLGCTHTYLLLLGRAPAEAGKAGQEGRRRRRLPRLHRSDGFYLLKKNNNSGLCFYPRLINRNPRLRGTHLLANLGWVDFDLGCSTVFPSYSRLCQFPISQAEGGTTKIKVNPAEVRQEMGTLVLTSKQSFETLL